MAASNTYVKWAYLGKGFGLEDSGHMPLADIPKHIQRFEKEAKKLLDSTNKDHVLYAKKFYDSDGKPTEVQFFLAPMDNETFEHSVGAEKGVQVYALHKLK